MAEEIRRVLEKKGFQADLRNVFEARPSMLPQYDVVLLGSSTWANGDLQSDFIPFEREMDGLDLSGVYIAAFGPGNSRFTFFAEAVEILEAKLLSCGGTRLYKKLQCDELGGQIMEETVEWAEEVAKRITKKVQHG